MVAGAAQAGLRLQLGLAVHERPMAAFLLDVHHLAAALMAVLLMAVQPLLAAAARAGEVQMRPALGGTPAPARAMRISPASMAVQASLGAAVPWTQA